MRRLLQNFLTITASLFLCGVLLTSCEDIHAPIFYYINQEVAIEEYGITSDVSGIIESGGYIYTTTGHIYKKKAEQSSQTGTYNKGWQRCANVPGRMFGIASDGTNLYSLQVKVSNTDAGINAYTGKTLYKSTDGDHWEPVESADGVKALIQDKKNNKGYAKKSDGVYELKSSGISTTKLTDSSGSTISVSNDKPFDGASVFGNNMYYFSEGGTTLYWSSDGTKNEGRNLVSSPITALELTGDFLLIGTESGIYKVRLNNEKVPAESLTSFTNNAQAIMSSSYKVTSIFALESNKNESETDIYAGITIKGAFTSYSHATFSSIGLYAYYPGRETWNRDGTSDGSTTPKGN